MRGTPPRPAAIVETYKTSAEGEFINAETVIRLWTGT